MKTAIVFASTHGTTILTATYLSEKLLKNIGLIQLLEAEQKVDLTRFDQVILGGSI
ncbi:flavodoxin domain-containing protein [Amphibacillus sediminis]|uniref:flavodoxin domain-containing protein n=1 Tax=Amphibacillus sediminis TaxID=360185 RepID=UPI0012ED5BA9|nr:flavodoxin domain-containing protein [Amphibacillus sediminis]